MGAASAGGAGLVEVENSALFNSAASERLTLTPTASDDDINTMSCWVYRAKFTGALQYFWAAGTSAMSLVGFTAAEELLVDKPGARVFTSTQLFRDIGWYHIVVGLDVTNAVATNRVTVEVNGVEITAWATDNRAALTAGMFSWGDNIIHGIGATGPGAAYFDGYIAEFTWMHGTKYSASDFGEYDTTGLYWTPKSSTDIKALTFGAEGFYLDNTTNAQTDASGNGNNWTNNNSVVTVDYHTPTKLGLLINPLFPATATTTYINGNKSFKTSASSQFTIKRIPTTLTLPDTGKWILGFTTPTPTSSGNGFGLVNAADFAKGDVGFPGSAGGTDAYLGYHSTISVALWSEAGSVSTAMNSGVQAADEYYIAVDLDNTKAYGGFWDNSASTLTWYAADGGTDGDPATGANPTTTVDYTGGSQFTMASINNVQMGLIEEADISITIPTGFSYFTPTNVYAETTRTQSDTYEYWNNILYTGNGTASTDITTSVNPEYLSIKNRSATDNFNIHSVIAGATKHTRWNSPTTAELTNANSVTSFGTGKFTLGTGAGGWNDNGENFVAWAAKLGGTPTADNSGGTTPTSGSVYIDDSISTAATGDSGNLVRLSANTVLGMSVGTFSGTGAVQTVMHGLGVAPGLIIVTRTDIAATVGVYSSAVGNTKGVILNETGAAVTSANFWNNTSPTSAVFTLNTTYNISGGDYQFTAFAPSEYISIGSYTGNYSTNGAFVPTLNSLGVPLQPVWSMLKVISGTTGSWVIQDAARPGYNVMGGSLEADLSNVENTQASLDYVTGGLKLRTTSGNWNHAHPYLYLTIGTPIIDVDGRILAGR